MERSLRERRRSRRDRRVRFFCASLFTNPRVPLGLPEIFVIMQVMTHLRRVDPENLPLAGGAASGGSGAYSAGTDDSSRFVR
jgi:hypothetical protein